MHKITHVTLGCPKNQVDTDELVEAMTSQGFAYAENPDESDAWIINTCCFIDDAKRESIEKILEVAKFRRTGSKLIVMGCMGEKYRSELVQEIPEIDVVYGVNDANNILQYLKSQLSPGNQSYPWTLNGGEPFHYVKIADGCNRNCSFCVIPSIRGRFRSTERGAILDTVERNLIRGAKEIILVAQDITGYGSDIPKGWNLSRLVRDIAELDSDFWLRLLYLYPTGINDELVKVMSNYANVCNYFDVPIQHSEDEILRSMRRGYTRNDLLDIVSFIRRNIQDAVLRTTLIVGYPGESDENFNALKDFVMEVEFDRLGVFKYSPQQGTSSYEHGEKISETVKDERFHEIMTIQAGISARKNARLVGQEFRALVDTVEDATGIGRLYGHAPEIDGEVIIRNCPEQFQGKFVHVRITDAYDYDLAGDLIDEQ